MSQKEKPCTFLLDGQEVPFAPGQTVIQAALAAGHYIPHLCYHPEFKPHGSCKVCTVSVNGRTMASCTMPAQAGMEVLNQTEELNRERKTLVQMLFVEGNHFCPSCEKSGNCMLQAVAYDLEIMSPELDHLFPNRPVDASHPDILLDFNREARPFATGDGNDGLCKLAGKCSICSTLGYSHDTRLKSVKVS